MPDPRLIRHALCRWAFNTLRRNDPRRSPEVTAALRWAAANTPPVADLCEPAVLRRVLAALAVRLDGQPAAPSVEAAAGRSSARPLNMPWSWG